MPETKPEHGAAPAEVKIEKLVYGGNGLARLEGQVVFVPFVLPGETVLAKVERARPGLLEASLAEVREGSAERVQPGCPYFGKCGGCQYQQAGYEFQLEQKKEILRDVFQRIGKFEAPEIEVLSGPPWEYRNRTQFHVVRGQIGYFRPGSHDLCAVEKCPISSPAINAALAALRGMLRDRRFPNFVNSLELFTNEAAVLLNVGTTGPAVARRFFDWCAERIPGLAAGSLEYPAMGETFRVGHGSFFQVNRFLADATVERALDGAAGERALDLYAGVGLFSLPLARRFAQVTAVESGGSASRDLAYNAERAGLAVNVVHNSSEPFLEGLETAPDFVLADPPRSGLGKRVVEHLLRLRPRLLTLVSCDPATLARDLAGLRAGGYQIRRLTLIDLFPQTFHIETIVRLERIE